MTDGKLVELLAAGFTRSVIWSPSHASNVFPEVARQAGIYAFVMEGRVKYIGSAKRHLYGRMRSYLRRQRASLLTRPVHDAIAKIHECGGEIELYTLVIDPGDRLVWRGLPIDLLLGLEEGLIQKFDPEWNRRGRLRNTESGAQIPTSK